MNWHYTNNQFLTATAKNYKKAYELSVYHDAALGRAVEDNPGDTDFQMLYDRYHPAHLAYITAYIKWDSAGGSRQSETLNVKQLMRQITSKLDDWEPAVQIVYKKQTPGFKKIFPDNRKPFNTGSIDNRIAALNTLAENIGDDIKLKDVKTDVLDFYNLINKARTAQEGSKSAKDNRSDEVEAARIPIMQLQYATTGFLINKWFDMPEKAQSFFYLTLLRDIEQSLFTGKVKADTLENIFVRTFSADDKLRLKSTSADGFTAYLSNSPGTIFGKGITVESGEEKMVSVADFEVPDIHLYRYLNIQNKSSQSSGFEIEIE